MSELLGRLSGQAANPKVAELMRSPLFDNVPRRQLALMAANLDEVRVDSNEVLIEEDHHNDAFWILLEGEVEMTIGGQVHRIIEPGGFFGVTSMLDGRPAVATVRTCTPIRALVASAEQFRALEGNETIAVRLMHAALERMREDLEIQKERRRVPE
jgi:CRP-like cAMP-binding protein